MTVTDEVLRHEGDVLPDLRSPATPDAIDDRGGHILIVCASGGHLAQLVARRRAFEGRRTRGVTFPTADAASVLGGEDLVHAYYPTTRNLPNLLRNTWLAARLLRRERPSAIISTGAAVAFPFFVFGWLLRVPTVYIEVFDRLDTRTLTARLCRPFTSKMLVQWEEQLVLYRDAVLVGALL